MFVDILFLDIIRNLYSLLNFEDFMNLLSTKKAIRNANILHFVRPYIYLNYKKSLEYILCNNYRKEVIKQNKKIIIDFTGMEKVPQINLNIKSLRKNINKLSGTDTINIGHNVGSIFQLEDFDKIQNVNKFCIFVDSPTYIHKMFDKCFTLNKKNKIKTILFEEIIIDEPNGVYFQKINYNESNIFVSINSLDKKYFRIYNYENIDENKNEINYLIKWYYKVDYCNTCIFPYNRNFSCYGCCYKYQVESKMIKIGHQLSVACYFVDEFNNPVTDTEESKYCKNCNKWLLPIKFRSYIENNSCINCVN